MSEKPIRLRVHVNEPFGFERENESADLLGASFDPLDEDADEWLIRMDLPFMFNEEEYREMLVAPHYVGEHLGRVFDRIVGFPVRIAHRTEEGWHFAMTGMLSIPHEDKPPQRDDTNSPADDLGAAPGNEEDSK